MTLIALLTDFGLRDTYVGQMKLVIAGIAPGVPVVDLGHGVEPQQVREGAWLLETAVPFLPEGAVVVAVVDPGVGTARLPIVVRAAGRFFVGPDNGLLSGAFPPEARRGASPGSSRVSVPPGIEVRSIDLARFALPNVSATFHGRDVFAPAAAHLASGVPFQGIGPRLAEVSVLPPFEGVRLEDGRLQGEVIHVDRFGNLITTIRAEQLPARCQARVGAFERIPFARTFAEVAPGAPLCHVDSSGFLAIAVRDGSAAERFGVGLGAPVEVEEA
ncbi:Adenosyl-chloride synthase [bacterium HR29]|jgi:S-adenosylmethionine hydrolase|nr:Adenosyl-chloride synthase [bacterium HR29]